jgi:hypothetical protein
VREQLADARHDREDRVGAEGEEEWGVAHSAALAVQARGAVSTDLPSRGDAEIARKTNDAVFVGTD